MAKTKVLKSQQKHDRYRISNYLFAFSFYIQKIMKEKHIEESNGYSPVFFLCFWIEKLRGHLILREKKEKVKL
jgi:hypothetical protein